MNDWFLAGWDIHYIIGESLKWHISSYQSKQTTVPEPWKDAVAEWVRKMGYRFELRRAKAGTEDGTLKLELLSCNTGSAPCYNEWPIVVRLRGSSDSKEWRLDEDIRNWLPGEDRLVRAELPADLPAGEYEVSVGIDTGVRELGRLHLANEGRDADGMYPVGDITVGQPERRKDPDGEIFTGEL